MDHPLSSHEAFITLLLRHEPMVRAAIRAVVLRAEDVDEVMQAVSLVAWRKFDSLTDRVTVMLVDEAGSVFAKPRQPGEVQFDPGTYELLSGTVHLRYVNGADLIFEGPARFEIRNTFRSRDERHPQFQRRGLRGPAFSNEPPRTAPGRPA